MPELAEVEYYRKQWDSGVGAKIERVQLHKAKRIFRGIMPGDMESHLPGSVLVASEANGKQLLFRFSGDLWLGLHLGMTGKLLLGTSDVQPGTHDHLVLFQRERALIFNDPRLFGRVQFSRGETPPEWWSKLPVPVNAPSFKRPLMEHFLNRHAKLGIKPTLLLQSGFPGIGNWMADEILWRAKIHPRTPTGHLSAKERATLWASVRFVCRGALRHVSPNFADPPRGWLFHERWSRGGNCPIHKTPLMKETIGGRSTAWCPRCQGKAPLPLIKVRT